MNLVRLYIQRLMVRSILPALCIFTVTGCATTFETPQTSETVGGDNSHYTLVQFQKDYENYKLLMIGHDYANATVARDMMVYRILDDIEWNYGMYKGKLHVARGGIATVSDAASLGLSAAATVVGGAEIKSILSVTDTALKGLTSSYNKNLYAEQTTEVLITSMDALHKAKQTDIINNLTKMDASKYPFEAAKLDLTQLFLLGTREAGLCALSADAGKKAADAQAAADQANSDRVVAAQLAPIATSDLVSKMRAIQQKIIDVRNDNVNGLKDGLRILANLKISAPAGASLDDVVKLLIQQQTDAYNAYKASAAKDSSKITTFYNAIFTP